MIQSLLCRPEVLRAVGLDHKDLVVAEIHTRGKQRNHESEARKGESRKSVRMKNPFKLRVIFPKKLQYQFQKASHKKPVHPFMVSVSCARRLTDSVFAPQREEVQEFS